MFGLLGRGVVGRQSRGADRRALERLRTAPVFIALQLRMAVSLEQAALEPLSRIWPAEPLDQLLGTMHQAYALILAVVTGQSEARRHLPAESLGRLSSSPTLCHQPHPFGPPL